MSINRSNFFTGDRNFFYYVWLQSREVYTSNQLLTRARKANFSSQRDFGRAVAAKLGESISVNYAQKKASLWESGNLIPTPNEMWAISEILNVPPRELEESFSPGVLPFSAADLIRSLARSSEQGLIASCFPGRVRARLLEEDEDALRQAIQGTVSVAIFFPFPLESLTAAGAEYAQALTNNHREVWRSIVKFWKIIRSFSPDSAGTKVRLYRPRDTGGANVLLPPMFYRPTLLCDRRNGITKVDLYTWTQGDEHDGFYRIGGRSLEDSEFQAEAWELFFGGIFSHWSKRGDLPECDEYWQSYIDQSE